MEESEKLCPSAEVLSLLGQMLPKEEPARAEGLLRRAVEMSPGIPEAHYRLALLLRAKGGTRPRTIGAQLKFRRSERSAEANPPLSVDRAEFLPKHTGPPPGRRSRRQGSTRYATSNSGRRITFF